jgi:predicted nucleic acid-binding protein
VRVFVDTSFLVALVARADVNHSAAVQLWQRQHPNAVTSNHVLGETWTFVNRRYGFGVARAVVSSVHASKKISVVHISPQLEEQAWAWLGRHDEREYSFVDATSFAFMRKEGIMDALAFDGDFSAGGFTELRR